MTGHRRGLCADLVVHVDECHAAAHAPPRSGPRSPPATASGHARNVHSRARGTAAPPGARGTQGTSNQVRGVPRTATTGTPACDRRAYVRRRPRRHISGVTCQSDPLPCAGHVVVPARQDRRVRAHRDDPPHHRLAIPRALVVVALEPRLHELGHVGHGTAALHHRDDLHPVLAPIPIERA